MTFHSGAKVAALASIVFLVSACGQGMDTEKSMSKTDFFRNLEVPVTFQFPENWHAQTTGPNTVTVLSPVTVAERQTNATPSDQGPEGNAMAEAYGKPDIEITFYSDIAQESMNKDQKLNASSVEDLVKKDTFTPMGEVSVDGRKGYAVCDGELMCQYYWYVQTPGQIYRIYFGKHVSPQDLTLTPDEKVIIDSMELVE